MPPIMPGQGQQQNNPMEMLKEIDNKLSAIMEHIGCDYKGNMSHDNYMNMPDEEKDNFDQKQILGKT